MFSFMASNDIICQQGLQYADDRAFVSAAGIKVLLAFAGCISFGVVYTKQRMTASFHPNARLLLLFHIFYVICAMLGIIFGEGYDFLRLTLFRWLYRNTDCLVPGMSPYYSNGVKLLKVFGYTGSTYTATAWVLERAFATVFVNSYEHKKNWLGWILGFIGFLLAIILVIFRICLADFEQLHPITMMNGHSYYLSMANQYLCAGLEAFNVCVLFIIWLINTKRLRNTRRIMSSLTYKYQLKENVVATSLIFPLALLHCIAYFPTALLMPLISLQTSSNIDRFKNIAYTDWMPIYFLALPALLWWRNGARVNAVRQLVQSNRLGEAFASQRKDGNVETARHFEVLEQMFHGK
ncbi:hypothetical protein L596_026172 [Steinernema carpocapsae]|uniref:G-protein coupled receptors family 1 profile domain-containing protein n=1 Tax=Steinernema carpocapsae TaxID=34508 RepID=A0A4U5M0K0_STECR|nr:hypothetical protein L596_026172 [Steinernema carpocapsae]